MYGCLTMITSLADTGNIQNHPVLVFFLYIISDFFRQTIHSFQLMRVYMEQEGIKRTYGFAAKMYGKRIPFLRVVDVDELYALVLPCHSGYLFRIHKRTDEITKIPYPVGFARRRIYSLSNPLYFYFFPNIPVLPIRCHSNIRPYMLQLPTLIVNTKNPVPTVLCQIKKASSLADTGNIQNHPVLVFFLYIRKRRGSQNIRPNI